MRIPVVVIISVGASDGDRGNGIVYWKGESRDMTKKEVLEMLYDMLEETVHNIGFIAGFITKSSAISMIERKIKEVEDLEEP